MFRVLTGAHTHTNQPPATKKKKKKKRKIITKNKNKNPTEQKAEEFSLFPQGASNILHPAQSNGKAALTGFASVHVQAIQVKA